MGFIQSMKEFFVAGFNSTFWSNMRDELTPKIGDKESVEDEGKKDDEVVLNNVTRDNASAKGEGKSDDDVVPNNVTKLREPVEGEGRKDYEVGDIVTNATTRDMEIVESKDKKDDEVVLNNVTRHKENVEGEVKNHDEVVLNYVTNVTRHNESVEGEGKKDDEVVRNNVTNVISLKSDLREDVASSGSCDAIFVGDGKNDDNRDKGDSFSSHNWNDKPVDGVNTNHCSGDHQADGIGARYRDGEKTNQDNAKARTKSLRGRKRKNLQMSSNAQRAEMIELNEKPVVRRSRRVRRSTIVAVGANNSVEDLNNVDKKTDEGINEVHKKKLKLEKVGDGSVEPTIKGKEKKKPHKSPRRKAPRITASMTNPDMITVSNDEGLNLFVMLNIGTPLDKSKAEPVVSEKEDIINQTIDMIKRCGWRVDYIPRAARDFNNLLYINPDAEVHRSITSAYEDLKKRVNSGKANAVEQTGFVMIPDETLGELFRITKKRSDCEIKRCEGVEQNVLGRNRASSKMTNDVNREEKSQTGKTSNGQKRKSVPLQGRTKRQCALLARESWNRSMPNDDENKVLFKKSCNLLSWMIKLGTFCEGAVVQYRDPIRGTPLLEGKIKLNGLFCNCCHEVRTILGFQLHAGMKLGEPLRNIYLGSSGLSLFHCMVNSWNHHVKRRKIRFCSVDVARGDYNDDKCNMCGDVGDLICCDCCPSTFHLSCLDMKNVPAGDWHCMYCTCKFCRSAGYEALSQNDGHHLLTCQLCEAKFHSTCTDQTDAKSMNSANVSFCGSGCQKIFDCLQKVVGLKQEMEGGLSWTILRCYDIGNDASLCDYPLKVECNAKLAVAFSVMNECFLPVVDPRSQSEMVTNVIYNCGSNFRRLNYSGFHTFILEKGDEVVSAASIRFHGTQLAEMPFIATRSLYRHQGMSRQLLTVIEKVLSSMDIEKLIIPAVPVPNVMAMWKNSFGFVPVEETTREEMKSMSIIVFKGTYVLQKSLPPATGSGSEPTMLKFAYGRVRS